MALDSDTINGDEKLNVEFYINKIQGHPNEGKPYCRKITPGDQTNIVDQMVTERDKQRFPRQWLYFQMQTVGDGPAIGIPLEDWHKDRPHELGSPQLDELRILKFQVVEQVANASDRQLERIGMGGVGLREKARGYVNYRGASESALEMEKMRQELAEMRAFMTKSSPGLNADKRTPGPTGKDAKNVNHNAVGSNPAGDI